MTIKEIRNGDKLVVKVAGRIDTMTSPEFLEYLKANLSGVKELELDLEGVNYVSSAGLRTILFAQKTMEQQGKMVVSHVCQEIMETFELTCFTDILTII